MACQDLVDPGTETDHLFLSSDPKQADSPTRAQQLVVRQTGHQVLP